MVQGVAVAVRIAKVGSLELILHALKRSHVSVSGRGGAVDRCQVNAHAVSRSALLTPVIDLEIECRISFATGISWRGVTEGVAVELSTGDLLGQI